MSQRNDSKLRTCKTCQKSIESTAKGIKAHQETCTTVTQVKEGLE